MTPKSSFSLISLIWHHSNFFPLDLTKKYFGLCLLGNVTSLTNCLLLGYRKSQRNTKGTIDKKPRICSKRKKKKNQGMWWEEEVGHSLSCYQVVWVGVFSAKRSWEKIITCDVFFLLRFRSTFVFFFYYVPVTVVSLCFLWVSNYVGLDIICTIMVYVQEWSWIVFALDLK